MREVNDGGPAFPFAIRNDTDAPAGSVPAFTTTYHHGMTLRDYFAAAVLPAVYKLPFNGTLDAAAWSAAGAASRAYAVADAMLKKRAK